MRLSTPEPAAALLGLRAMKTVASADGAIGSVQRTVIEAARRVILRIDADLDGLPPITPEAFAAAFTAPELRRQFVNGLLVVALADGIPSRAMVAKVEAFAEALGVGATEVRDLRRLSEHHLLLFKLDFLRRSQVGEIMLNQLEQHGLKALARSVLGLRGLAEDQALAARYRAWEKLPDDTLGSALLAFYRKNGFALPGERGGFPEAGLYHDLSHVLGGYDTSPEGEVQVAAFSAGYKRNRPFYVVLFALMVYSTGVNVRPTAGGYTTVGVLGKPGMAERLFAAIERGSQVTTDLADKWDYWPYVGLPLEEARRRLNVVPQGLAATA